jgi:hypothetical protein
VILVEERYGEQRIRMKTDSGTQPEDRNATGRPEDRKNGRTEERKNGRTEERKNGRTEERKNGRTEERKKKLRLENGWKYSGALSSVALHNDDLRKKEERNQVERR